jgi:hypothetical protein
MDLLSIHPKFRTCSNFTYALSDSTAHPRCGQCFKSHRVSDFIAPCGTGEVFGEA